MTGGPLPWAHLDAMKQHKMIAECKKFARTGGRYQLFEKCPREYDEIMDVIDNIGWVTSSGVESVKFHGFRFFERPNYYKIVGILEAAVERLRIDRNGPLDWQEHGNELLRKASVIGDLGMLLLKMDVRICLILGESNFLSARMKGGGACGASKTKEKEEDSWAAEMSDVVSTNETLILSSKSDTDLNKKDKH